VTGTFQLPRYLSDTLLDAWSGTTRYMLEWRCTGPQIADSAYSYQLNIYIPGLYFTHAAPTGPAMQRAQIPVQWRAATPPAPAAGQPTTAHMGPIYVEVFSDVAEHQLL
jgi:hypothetical protein